jgi:RNA polymerase sigma-70 factor, ECF subfamily
MSADAAIREHCMAGSIDRATALALEIHGREIMIFLLNRTGDDQLASDAFAQFAEDVWRGLPRFEFRSSLRTWVFTLAHHALARLARQHERERQRRVVVLAGTSAFEVAERVRTETLPYLRSEAREGIARLRDRLPAEDQLLLELRINQKFSWKDIASITLEKHALGDEEKVKREAARLRKRFELIKKQLRALAEAGGLVPDT